ELTGANQGGEMEAQQVQQPLSKKKNKNNPSFILHSGPPYANDTHGLPIEHKMIQAQPDQKINLRQICHDFALTQVQIQKEQLKKIGLFTDFEKYYITLDKEYEAEQIRVFGEMVKKGLIYRGFRPIHWSWSHETALAENEIEYLEKKDTSLYFKIKLVENSKFSGEENINLIFSGEEILGLHYIHPYRKNDESSYIVDGDEFIRENEGTGLVHLAPAFGAEDFNLAKKEKIISEISCPLEPSGYFNEKIKVSEFIGKHYTEVNDLVIADLEKKNLIIKKKETIHIRVNVSPRQQIQVIEKKLYSIDEKTNYTVEKIDNLESTVFRGSSCVALKGTLSLKDGKKKKSIDFICYSHSSIVDPYLSPNALENYFPQTDIKFKQKTFFTWQKILFVFLSLGTVLFLFRTYKDIQAHPEHSAGRVIKGKNAIQKEIAKEQQQKDKKKREAEQRREAKITSPDEIVHERNNDPNSLFEPEHVILYGPPGTGKTFLAQSIAKDSGSFFLNLNGADFETSLAEAFGNKEGPSSAKDEKGNPKTIVALIDEIDRMGGGLDSTLPDALLRQGRIGVKLLVNYPNKKELYEIITKVLKKFHIDNVKKTGGYEAFGNLEREAFANKFAKPVHEIMISNDFSVSYKDLMENYLPAGVDPNDRRTLFTGADVEAILYRLELRNEFTEEDWRQFSEQQMGVKNPNYLLGAVKEAISYEANALMIYLGAPQNSF
ncbi:21774_t:CDS:10, partial [Entrophospora sp. SA101]